jgi:hypothetical protein
MNQLVQDTISLVCDHILINTDVQLHSPPSMDNQESRSRNKLIILGDHRVNRDVYAMNEQAVRGRVIHSVAKCPHGTCVAVFKVQSQKQCTSMDSEFALHLTGSIPISCLLISQNEFINGAEGGDQSNQMTKYKHTSQHLRPLSSGYYYPLIARSGFIHYQLLPGTLVWLRMCMKLREHLQRQIRHAVSRQGTCAESFVINYMLRHSVHTLRH